jgi:RNA polymerase sigma-70 factor (ECF subfamily)
LIECSLAGDGDAFVDVVRRHAVPVSSYLVRRVGRGPAEDLLGEVWVAAFSSRHSYDRSYPDARPWLYGIAHNTVRRHWRNEANGGLMLYGVTPPTPFDPWPAVDEEIDGAVVMRQALRGLPTDERDVLLLVAWEQCTVAEAARTLGIPAGTARRCLHQARMALREAPGIVAMLNALNAVKEA